MLRTVLVPLDGSALAEAVLGPLRRVLGGADRTASAGTRRTARFGPSITLLHAVPGGPGAKVELELGQSRAAFDRVRQELELSGLAASVLVVRGDPVEAIVRSAKEVGADLVAMATHGRTGAARLARGSVAEGVMQRCDAPLLLVNPHTHRAASSVVRRLLVPLDGSDEARAVLPAAAELARPGAAEVLLVRVLEPAAAGPERLRAAEASLEPAAHALAALGVTSVRRLVRVGRPADEVLALVEAERVDLVAMTTHGRRGLERLWLGSVAEGVTRAAVVPVVVQRSASETVAR